MNSWILSFLSVEDVIIFQVLNVFPWCNVIIFELMDVPIFEYTVEDVIIFMKKM